jgi:hypothetical protein
MKKNVTWNTGGIAWLHCWINVATWVWKWTRFGWLCRGWSSWRCLRPEKSPKDGQTEKNQECLTEHSKLWLLLLKKYFWKKSSFGDCVYIKVWIRFRPLVFVISDFFLQRDEGNRAMKTICCFFRTYVCTKISSPVGSTLQNSVFLHSLEEPSSPQHFFRQNFISNFTRRTEKYRRQPKDDFVDVVFVVRKRRQQQRRRRRHRWRRHRRRRRWHRRRWVVTENGPLLDRQRSTSGVHLFLTQL